MSSESNENLHPARLAVEELLSQCDVRRQKRSGPGGQHRNKVETAVILTHQPTGISAEANERRSQSENHAQAVFRLRMRLALEIRNVPEALPDPSPLWRERCVNQRIKIREDHPDLPALLAEVLDLLAAGEYDIKAVAEHLEASPSQLVKFLKTEPKALALVNRERLSRGLLALK